MENKAHALAAGAFLLLVAALLVGLAVWLTRDRSVRNDFELTTRESVSGLQPQAAVRFRGVPVGKVTRIGFDPANSGHVLIRIAVDQDAPVTRSTFATLSYQGITGLAFIQLDDTGQSKEALTAAGDEPPRIPLRNSVFGQLQDQGARLLSQVDETVRRMNLLLAPENQKQLMASIAQAGEAAQGVRQLSTQVDALLQAQFAPNRLNLPGLAKEAQGTLQSVQATSAEWGRLAQRLNEKGGAIDRVAEGADALAQGAATLNAGTLPRVNRASDDTARAARQIGRTAAQVSEQPTSLIYGHGPLPPGPGEPGFAAPGARP